MKTNRFSVAALAVLLAALAFTPVPSAQRALAAAPSPLTAVKTLSPAQVSTLQRSGIRTLAQLAASDTSRIAQVLAIDATRAAALVESARTERVRLERVYAQERTRFTLVRSVGARGGESEADAYARRIAPTNECTILVRKVCGTSNQCADSPGCPVAKQLLGMHESGNPEALESCLVSLEDGIVFAACTKP